MVRNRFAVRWLALPAPCIFGDFHQYDRERSKVAAGSSDPGLDDGPEIHFGEQAGGWVDDDRSSPGARCQGLFLDVRFDTFCTLRLARLCLREFRSEGCDRRFCGESSLNLSCYGSFEAVGAGAFLLGSSFSLPKVPGAKETNEACTERGEASEQPYRCSVEQRDKSYDEAGDSDGDCYKGAGVYYC